MDEEAATAVAAGRPQQLGVASTRVQKAGQEAHAPARAVPQLSRASNRLHT